MAAEMVGKRPGNLVCPACLEPFIEGDGVSTLIVALRVTCPGCGRHSLVSGQPGGPYTARLVAAPPGATRGAKA